LAAFGECQMMAQLVAARLLVFAQDPTFHENTMVLKPIAMMTQEGVATIASLTRPPRFDKLGPDLQVSA
jgi:hypothetical protein